MDELKDKSRLYGKDRLQSLDLGIRTPKSSTKHRF